MLLPSSMQVQVSGPLLYLSPTLAAVNKSSFETQTIPYVKVTCVNLSKYCYSSLDTKMKFTIRLSEFKAGTL